MLGIGIGTHIAHLGIGDGAGVHQLFQLHAGHHAGDVAGLICIISNNRYVILFIINILLLVIGTFMDMTPACLLFTPIFLPICQTLGMNTCLLYTSPRVLQQFVCLFHPQAGEICGKILIEALLKQTAEIYL